MDSADSNALYKVVSKFYDLFDVFFFLGGKGSPRSGLLEAIGKEPKHVLEICVGTASNAILVARNGGRSQVVGIDISEDMLAIARQKISQAGLTNIDLRLMSADALQFGPDSFDTVIISLALHELKADLRERIFREVVRVLKPGGGFYVIDFARQSSWINRVAIRVWSAIEPPCFVDFLSLDWHTYPASFGLCLESEKEYSFSKLYVLRKAEAASP